MSGDEGVRVALGDPLRCQLLAHVVRHVLGEHQLFAWTSQNSDNGLSSHLVCSRILTRKSSNERVFILTLTHSMHIFGEIPFGLNKVYLHS